MKRKSNVRYLMMLIGLLVLLPGIAQPQSACDLNGDSTVNVADVQLSVNMALGLVPCTANIAGQGVCNVVTVQRVVNTVLGGTCVVNHSVSLNWTASTSTVAGYNVYRATTSGGPYTKLNSSVVTGVAYTDSTVQSGLTYYYVTTAVDASGSESAFSNQATAIVPAS
jgi:hypothetical protein